MLSDNTARTGFLGYDPYDALGSPILVRLSRVWALLGQLSIHALRIAPFNLRPLLGIAPALDAKALALLARGNFLLARPFRQHWPLDRGIDCLRLLRRVATSGFSGLCWGHPFPYYSRRSELPADFPNVVSTVYAAQAFLDGYEQTGDLDWLESARSACRFILTDLPRLGADSGFCFGYYPGGELPIHNANLLAAAFLARLARLDRDERVLEPVWAALDYTLADQQPDGSWLYDGPGSPRRKESFVDGFHTGFILEALQSIGRDTGRDLTGPIGRGLCFYLERLFAGRRPLRKIGQNWPLDLRDCAQAAITLMQLRKIHPEAAERAMAVADWTLHHMRARQGYFYHLRWKRMCLPISYVRFQGWMLLAFAVLLSDTGESNAA
jgi:hypothetical protein